MLHINEYQGHNGIVLELSGRLDSHGSVILEGNVSDLLVAGNHRLTLDVLEVAYINSTGLRTLAKIIGQCRNAGGDLRMVNVTGNVKKAFEIVGFDSFF